MKAILLLAILAVCCFDEFVAPPVNPEPPMPKEGTDNVDEGFLKLEYKKYLEEVVAVLEDDEDFKKQLDAMGKENLEEGAIAHYLQFANKNTRTRLDELKRIEVRRLKDLHKKMMREAAGQARANGRPGDMPSIDLEHLDSKNAHTFESEDLKKLIKKTTDDLKNLDARRHKEFKQYEMQKEHEFREKQKEMPSEEAKIFREKHEEEIKRHKDHPRVNHPGNKKQLEEVWSEEDQMSEQEFDPRTFFMLHDVDNDGYLNTVEIEALFQRELDKVYNSSNSDDDMVERNEEMNRMREHVFTEIDKDGDGMVSWKEFHDATESEKFNEDESWDTLDEEQQFDDEEMEAFEKALEEKEMERRNPHAEAQNIPAATGGEVGNKIHNEADANIEKNQPQPPSPVESNNAVQFDQHAAKQDPAVAVNSIQDDKIDIINPSEKQP